MTRWMGSGACVGVKDADRMFFVEGPRSHAEAKAICAVCPVIDECLSWALQFSDMHGVFGGKTRQERRDMRDEMKEAA